MPIPFLGINLKEQNNGFFVEQETYISNVQEMETNATLGEFRTTTNMLSCISQMKQEIVTGVRIPLQVTEETFQREDIKNNHSPIKNLKQHLELGIRYDELDLQRS